QGQKVILANFKDLQREGKRDSERQELTLQALNYYANMQEKPDQPPAHPVIVILKHCAVLNSKTLTPFLHENLEHLEIHFSPEIKDADIEAIGLKCSRLKKLYLIGCIGLRNVSSGFLNNPVNFLKLEHLEIKECQQLSSLLLKASLLKSLAVSKNPMLKTI